MKSSNYVIPVFDRICSRQIKLNDGALTTVGKEVNSNLQKTLEQSKGAIEVFSIDAVMDWMLKNDVTTSFKEVCCLPVFEKMWFEFKSPENFSPLASHIGILMEEVADASEVHTADLVGESGGFLVGEGEKLLKTSLFLVHKEKSFWVCICQCFTFIDERTGKFKRNIFRPLSLQMAERYLNGVDFQEYGKQFADFTLIGALKTLDLLHSTSIGTRNHSPEKALVKAFEKKSKNNHRLVLFKTLTIKTKAGEFPFENLMLPQEEVNPNVTVTGGKALHKVRGHLKRFTEQKPLFGKHVGVFFVESHERGNSDNGVVLKNYLIK